MDIPLPPAVYDHGYRGALIARRGTPAQVEYFCHTLQGVVSPYRALGCAKVTADRCVIMITRVGGHITAHVHAQLRRHELGHCNGWPANHPNRR